MSKHEQRERARKLRSALTGEERREKDREIFNNLMSMPEIQKARSVMIYLSFGSEVDTFRILEELLKSGKSVYAPVTDPKTCHMTAVRVENQADLKRGAYGVAEPGGNTSLAPQELDVILIPGLVFDESGGRIGYGAGYYDRFLRKTNAVKAALCYELQLVEKAETDPWDENVDCIVTERAVIRCGKAVSRL